MASITAPTASIARSALVQKPSVRSPSSPVLGLPKMAMKAKVRCSMEEKTQNEKANMGLSTALLVAASAAVSSPAAMALVDERMSTEGTGLPFGLSNNLLGWILFGVFGLIWALYFAYVGSLDEDEESGLSL